MSEAILLEIVQQVKKLEEWRELPKRLTMPISNACDTCPRRFRLGSTIHSQGYSRREEYRTLTKEERAQLRENVEKYFYYAKALLRSFRGVKGINPYITFKALPACPHVQTEESKLSIKFGNELRQSIKPLADLMVKIVLDEEQDFKKIIKSPYLMAYYVDGKYEGLRLICQNCIKQKQATVPFTRTESEIKQEFPCGSLDNFSIHDCLSQQLRTWLKSNEFELKDDVIDIGPLHTIPDITLAIKDKKNYLLMPWDRSIFSVDIVTRLKRLDMKVCGLIARKVISLLLELPVEDDWLAYDLETDQIIRSPLLIKLSDVSIENLVELIIHQNIETLDHDAIKRLYNKLGIDQGYITGEEMRVEGGAVDVAWYDKDRKCIMAMEVESSAGASIARDVYKMKTFTPKIMVLVIKKGRNIDAIRNYSKETGGLPLLAMFPGYSWILFEQGNIIKMGVLKSEEEG